MDDPSVIDLWHRRLPRYLYVEDLIVGRSVVEIGCGLGVGCDFFLDKGAREVVGVDRDEAILARARQRYGGGPLRFLRWEGALALPDGTVDLVTVPEGAEWLEESALLEEVRRILRPQGSLVLSVPSADRPGAAGGYSYYDLQDRLGPWFPRIRMIGQAPFLAYSLVEYAEGNDEPELALDTSLVEGDPEAVSHYLVLAGPEEGTARGFTIVQVPFAPLENRVRAASRLAPNDPNEEDEEERPEPEPEAPARAPLGVLPDPEPGAGARAAEAEARAAEAEVQAVAARARAETAEAERREAEAAAAEIRAQSEAERMTLERRIAEAEGERARVATEAALELAALRRQLE